MPGIPAVVYRLFYDFVAFWFGSATPWHFMNYGFDSRRFQEHPLQLLPDDERDRVYIQLYEHLLSPLSIPGTNVLDVGCGRGGGVAYIARYLKPRRTIGLDLSLRGLRICADNYHGRSIMFVAGDAQRLPFTDGSFDVVVNVESSHAYGSMPAFLAEVRRVLTPGGRLVVADLRWDTKGREPTSQNGLATLKRELRESGLDIEQESNISSGVLQARAGEVERQRTSIRQSVPRGLRRIFAELAGLPGTAMFNHLKEQRVVYWSCVLRKRQEGAGAGR